MYHQILKDLAGKAILALDPHFTSLLEAQVLPAAVSMYQVLLLVLLELRTYSALKTRSNKKARTAGHCLCKFSLFFCISHAI